MPLRRRKTHSCKCMSTQDYPGSLLYNSKPYIKLLQSSRRALIIPLSIMKRTHGVMAWTK